MSNLIVVLGESGTGKSTSLRNLDPDSTFLINVLGKPLPMRGYKKLFNEYRKNYLDSDDYGYIIRYMQAINDRRPEIKRIIIDDFSFLMSNEFMRRCREKDFSKFTDMGANAFDLMNTIMPFRDDLYCYIFCHTGKDHSGLIKPKTVGKMTEDHVCITERVTIAFHSQIVDRQYKFLTQNDGMSIAKSPMGMFEDLYIDNDLAVIDETIRQYYEGDEQ